ncbi:MAG: glycerophosphodiester phosphodiesterase [Anaerolineae bacterium]|nr:glycerophosphodiester phosphodiesterase [Anaerolineae bacterium]
MPLQRFPAKTFTPSRRWLQQGGCLSILVLLPLLYYGLYFARRGPLPAKPQLIAHRGGPAYAPENTLAAFRHAVALGVDWLELDVQMSQDGAVVVMHDETVERTTNGAGRVGDLSLAQIRALDAGNGKPPPTLAEVVTLAKAAGVGLLVEIKSPSLYPGLEVKVEQMITEANYVEQTIIQSFDHQALQTIHSLNPNIQLGALYGWGDLSVPGLQPGRAAWVCPMAEMVVFNPWLIQQAHNRGQQVFIWFGLIEHPLLMRFLLALGADGLIVDDPLALAKILDR